VSVRTELFVGAAAFWSAARADLAVARSRVLVQAMTFEGDAAGQGVAAAIATAGARDRRVLVDDYTRFVVSDQWVANRRLPSGLAAEVASTRAMFRDLMARGVAVRVTNPIRSSLTNYPARNHKKLVVADDVAWLGGVNFSDHNFAWDDVMVRVQDAALADILAADFDATWTSRPRPFCAVVEAATLLGLDGRTNAAAMQQVEARIAAARAQIVLVSPYVTRPFLEHLARARARGVGVRLITPWSSNKSTVRDALVPFARRAGIELVLLARMSHLKGLSIDGRTLVVGSANFDIVSLNAEEELVLIIEDEALAADFDARVVAPLTQSAMPPGEARVPIWREGLARAALAAAGGAATIASAWPRRAAPFDWV
jgi:cardiolipin synthase